MTIAADIIAAYLVENGYDARSYGDDYNKHFGEYVDIHRPLRHPLRHIIRLHIESDEHIIKCVSTIAPINRQKGIDLAQPDSLDLLLTAIERCSECKKCRLVTKETKT